MCLTVCHQVFNSHERHIVFIGKLNALWCTRHRAIVISQLTQHTSWFKARQRHQIDSRFSMTATRQYTTCPREVGKRGPDDSDLTVLRHRQSLRERS